MLANIFVRILIAIIGAFIAIALFAPVMRVLGFAPSDDLLLIFRICVGAIGLCFIIWGERWFAPRP